MDPIDDPQTLMRFIEVREDPSEPLFHYTSVASLQHILAEKRLRATDIQHMNDARELSHGVSVLDELVRERMPSLAGKLEKCATQLRQWIAHGSIADHHVFVVCFTEKGNLLSQWRSYCPPGKGVSIGFSPDELVECVYDQNFRLQRVVYEREQQRTMHGYLLDALLESAEQYVEPGPKVAHPTQTFYKLFRDWEDSIIDFCAMMKHLSFAEEVEWRAISRPIRNSQDERLRFRDGTLTLTPYIELDLPCNGRGGVSLDQAFVGPTANQNIAMRAISTFLSFQKARPREGLRACGIPLRN